MEIHVKFDSEIPLSNVYNGVLEIWYQMALQIGHTIDDVSFNFVEYATPHSIMESDESP